MRERAELLGALDFLVPAGALGLARSGAKLRSGAARATLRA